MTKVALLQLPAMDGLPVEDALARVRAEVEAHRSADLIVLPEVWTPGYFAFDTYEEAAGRTEDILASLADLARQVGAYLHGGSLIEPLPGGGLANLSVLWDPDGGEVARYRKMHLFGYGSAEKDLLTPGDEVVVADTELGRWGMAVCYDLRFPELFRQMTDRGAIGFMVASAWPHPRVEAWTTFLQARAAENQAFLVAANGAGPATGASLCGRSAVVDPWGTVVAAAGDEPGAVVAEVDLAQADEARRRFPALADRRLAVAPAASLRLTGPDGQPIRFPVRRVVVAGYTARDTEAVRAYIAGLEEKGIRPPEEVPSYFAVTTGLVTTDGTIEVVGDQTCGEVEYALLVAGDDVYVAAASDHTDRALEELSVPASKQACPKVISPEVWSLEEVRDRWESLRFEARTPADSPELYQEGPVATLFHPDDLLDRVRQRLGREDLDGTVILSGTLGTLAGAFAYHASFRADLVDPEKGERLVASYQVRNIEEE